MCGTHHVQSCKLSGGADRADRPAVRPCGGYRRAVSDLQRLLAELSDDDFERLYGPVARSRPVLLDVIVSPERDGRWVFRRDPDVVEDVDRVTWRADDGIVYQTPEVTLAFKAALARPKDDADLEAALPRLDAAAVGWLTDTVARLHPGHRWLERLG